MKPVLILIHGAGLNGTSWDPVLRHLDTRFTVLTPDLPGHGARASEAFTMAGAVATVVEAARQAGDGPLVIAGDSLGGYTATAAAAALPATQLKGLVLSGCTANLSGFRVLLPFHMKSATIAVMLALMSQSRLAQGMVKQLKALTLSDEDARRVVAAGAHPGVFPQAVAALRDVDFRAKVAAIGQPILFVNGALDHIFTAQEASFIAAARQPRAHRFEGSAHGVSLLRSAEFAGQINQFCAPLFDLAPAASAA